jgi:hypothetical protein
MSSFATVLFKSLEEVVCVSGSVIVDDVGWVMRVNFVDVFA